MTTYPLSEAATIYATGDDGDEGARVLGKGTLADCVEIAQRLSDSDRSSSAIRMDHLDLDYGPAEIEELTCFLRDEAEGLTNKDIAGIAASIE